MEIANQARQQLPTRHVCRALKLSPASFYRHIAVKSPPVSPSKTAEGAEKRPHHRALSPQERAAVLNELHSERFVDMAPAAIHATLLDEGRHLCSVSTMYRILRANDQVRERRPQAAHPKRTPPQLVANAPNQVWTWDITHLRTTTKGPTLRLYVCMDLFSRYVVGWYLSTSESAEQARHLFQTLARREKIQPHKLILHADNGGPMRARSLAELLDTLAIERSHSRPQTSNDNAFSEAQFKTMKYRPTYPGSFESEATARQWCREFFTWYNQQHRHSGIAMLTPADLHTGKAHEKISHRAKTLQAAYQQHPQRFVKGPPKPQQPPKEVAINPAPKPPRSQPINEAIQPQEVSKF